MNYGFIGLGNMGGPMCRNIMSKCDATMRVFDPDVSAAQKCIEAGAILTGDIAELAAQSAVIYLALPTPAHVERLIMGDGGILDNARPGSLIIDLSTNSPHVARKMSEALSPRGIHYIEAPVTGGVLRAADGTLTIMVGCEETLVDQVTAHLAPIASQVTRVGEVGSASAIKIINNMMFLCNLAAAAEGTAMARKAGLDLDLFADVVRTGSGFSSGFRVVADKAARSDFKPGFSLGLACKDFEIAAEMQRDLQIPGFMAGPVVSLLRAAKGAGYADMDVGSVLKVYEAFIPVPNRTDSCEIA
jgi:3-hydroxyisobutyrate dehydrogenase-like beta-hydroxyacid dehydrogenase